MPKISTPLFRSDASESLAAVDAYDIASSKPINKLFNAAKDVSGSFIDRAGGVRNIAQGITNIVQLKSAGATGRQLLENSLGIFGTGAAGIIRTASDGILNKAGEFIDLDPSLVAQIKSTAEASTYQTQYGEPDDLSNYGELTALIGSLTGNSELAEYINIGYESAVWGAALTEAVNYGSSYYIGDVKQYIDPDVYRQALIYSIPAVASSGDLTALEQLTNQLTADVIMSNKPDFIKTFLIQFKVPTPLPVTPLEYSFELAQAMSLLNSRWYLYDRAGTDIFDLQFLSGASSDARKILELHPTLGPVIQVSPGFPEASVGEVIKEQFPRMIDIG